MAEEKDFPDIPEFLRRQPGEKRVLSSFPDEGNWATPKTPLKKKRRREKSRKELDKAIAARKRKRKNG